jgi:hypothetical protein
MSFISLMQEAARQEEVLPRDPWEPRLRMALEGVEAMSTAALLDLLRADPTTSNARRLAAIMRELNFVPIKTRRFMPGGFRDTVTRGCCVSNRLGMAIGLRFAMASRYIVQAEWQAFALATMLNAWPTNTFAIIQKGRPIRMIIGGRTRRRSASLTARSNSYSVLGVVF